MLSSTLLGDLGISLFSIETNIPEFRLNYATTTSNGMFASLFGGFQPLESRQSDPNHSISTMIDQRTFKVILKRICPQAWIEFTLFGSRIDPVGRQWFLGASKT